MFSRNDNKTFVDLSAELNDEFDWEVGGLRSFDHHLNVSAVAFDPVSGFLAIGTTKGIIEIYGAPGVEQRLTLSDGYRVRFLAFTSSAFRILCIDDHDRLHAWDLTNIGKPKLLKIVNYRTAVNCIAVSSSHTHVFIALSNGEIKTYDLLCSRNSPFTIPNLWIEYERKLSSSGMFSLETPGAELPVEVAIHPRDLNLLFIAYGGGVVLLDIKQQISLRTYEHVLPPGAPGGAGYQSSDLMLPRRPIVTAIAIHPAGHFFAVGYTDGTVAFWALEDEDKPLLVRTLDEVDLHLVDAGKLEEFFASQDQSSESSKPPPTVPREPVFKLTWSGFPNSEDPRGGPTVLTILGGLRADESPGVTAIQLPAFNPPEAPLPTSPASEVALHPSYRTAMRESLSPSNAYTYYTKGVAEDYLLIPRDSPHFSGSWDPIAILLLSDSGGGTRAIEAYQFPPPSFVINEPTLPASPPIKPKNAEEDEIDDVVSQELTSTIEAMKLDEDPKQIMLPYALWNGANGVRSADILSLPRDAYESLTNERDTAGDSLILQGGVAWVEDHENEMRLLKHQPRRILISCHNDLTVRFQDFSSQSLISSPEAPIQYYFPQPLSNLTIDIVATLAEPAVVSRTSPMHIQNAQIASVHLATEVLECAIVLRTGEVVVYKLAGSGVPAGLPTTLEDPELLSLKHVPVGDGQQFYPQFMIMTGRGPVSSCAISDIGFIATSHPDGSLFIVDSRGPRIMHRSLPDPKSARKSFLHKHDVDPIESLVWTVSGTAENLTPRILLIATRASGDTTIFTIERSQSGVWEVRENPETTEGFSNPIPGGSVVIDIKGNKYKADRNGLAAALAGGEVERKRSIWINAGAKGVKCVGDITGDRLGKVEWGSKVGKVEQIAIVQKNAATVLVAFTDRRQVLIYSIPHLELLHTLQHEQHSTEPLSVDDTGDYIEWVHHGPSGVVNSWYYGTLFNNRRSGPYQPSTIDFLPDSDPRVIPPQPQPVSVGPTSLLGSWLGYFNNQSMTGDQVDELLAGPDRPIPQPKVANHDVKDIEGKSTGSYGIDARSIASNASSGASNLYNRLGNALSERGQMLGQLQESFDSLEQGSRRMLAQSKTLAAKQTAKGWFGW